VVKIEDIKALKGNRKLTMLTAYDYPTAKILSRAGVDMLLVGDSLGMVVLGYPDTKSVTLQDIVRHAGAVVRGNLAAVAESKVREPDSAARDADGNVGSFVVADMPIHTTDTVGMALRNARYILEETGVDAVKIEGDPHIVEALAGAGIAVMAHTGLKPQQAEKYGLTGKSSDEAEAIFAEAVALEKAGAFALVLECIPSELAKRITGVLKIPTIGIGAGKDCDGQVLVSSDLLGLYDDFKPKFVRRYADLATEIFNATNQFKKDTENGTFPAEKESF
jgi:3-methyl-2-oxobutanoate hydroxymethyltransferase